MSNQLYKRLIIICFVFFNSLAGYGSPKDTLKYAVLGWRFGVSAGVYFADKTPAFFYNGSGENNLKAIIIDNPYNYAAIHQALHYDFSIDSTLLPKNMKYNPAITFGFIAKYNFNKQCGYFVEFNYAKLKVSDIFVIKIDSFNSTSEPSFRTAYLFGKEERIDFNIGLNKVFGKLNKIKPYLELGININDVKVLESTAQIANLSYNIVNPYNSYYRVVQGGIGFGVFCGTGIQAIFSPSFIMHIGTNINYKKINLGNNKPYKFQETIYIRLILKNIFSSREE